MSDFSHKKENRDKWLHLKVSESERLALKSLATQQNLTVADLVRSSIGQKNAGIRPRETRQSRRADPHLLAALGKIGSNLNQIGRWVNTQKSGAEAVEVLAALVQISGQIRELAPSKKESETDEAENVGSII